VVRPVRGDGTARKPISRVDDGDEEGRRTEYLDGISPLASSKVLDAGDPPHRKYGSHIPMHRDEDKAAAARVLKGGSIRRSSFVCHNASNQFADGGAGCESASERRSDFHWTHARAADRSGGREAMPFTYRVRGTGMVRVSRSAARISHQARIAHR